MSATSDAVGSDIRQIDGAHGGLVRAKPEKCRISTAFFIRDDRSNLPTTDHRKKPVINLRFNIKRLSMQLSHRIGPGIRDRADANLAAFTSAFGFARHSGLWRVPFDNLSRSRQALSGIGIFSGQNEGTRCIGFFSQFRSCRSRFPPVPSLKIHAARRTSKRPVPAMCSAIAVQ